jgi:hypothetical protein
MHKMQIFHLLTRFVKSKNLQRKWTSEIFGELCKDPSRLKFSQKQKTCTHSSSLKQNLIHSGQVNRGCNYVIPDSLAVCGRRGAE